MIFSWAQDRVWSHVDVHTECGACVEAKRTKGLVATSLAGEAGGEERMPLSRGRGLARFDPLRFSLIAFSGSTVGFMLPRS